VQVVIVQFGGPVFDVAPLSWDQWLLCLCLALLVLPVGLLLRLIPVPERHVFDMLRCGDGRRARPTQLNSVEISGECVELMEIDLRPE
jgi:hypothetical protein